MKKVLSILFLLISLGTLSFIGFQIYQNQSADDSSAAGQIEFFIDGSGNDTNPGTKDKPFKTIKKAQKAVKAKIDKGVNSNIIVYIRAGVYEITQPITFGTAEGGTDKVSVTYRSYQGENVRITGGKTLDGWQNIGNNIWSISLANISLPQSGFRNLYRNTERLQRARFPNEGNFMRVSDNSGDLKTIKFNTNFPTTLNNKDVEAAVLFHWDMGRAKVVSGSGQTLQTDSPVGLASHPFSKVIPGNAAFLENAYEFMDVPGEWYFDKGAKKLYIKLAAGDSPNSARKIILPLTDKLIEVKGSARDKVKNLHFYGLTLENTNWDYGTLGFTGSQAGHYLRNGDNAQYKVIPGSVHFENVANSSFIFNNVNNIGNSGITVGKGVINFSIKDNEFVRNAANCIHIGYNPERGHLGGDWDPSIVANDGVIKNVTIENNKISKCGEVFWSGNGIFAQFTKGTVIRHNEVFDLPYTGIAVTGSWAPGMTSQEKAKIVRNSVHDVMLKLADGGGIYTTGHSPDSEIIGNVVYRVLRSPWAVGSPNNGVFFDESSKDYYVEGNIVYNTAGESIRYNQTNEGNMRFGTNYFGGNPRANTQVNRLALSAGTKSVQCTDAIYSAWGQCKGGLQTRRALYKYPLGCSGGTLPTSRSCQ